MAKPLLHSWTVTLANDRQITIAAARGLLSSGGGSGSVLLFLSPPQAKEKGGNLIAAFAPGDWKRVQLIDSEAIRDPEHPQKP